VDEGHQSLHALGRIEPEPHRDIAEGNDREDRDDNVEDFEHWRPAAGRRPLVDPCSSCGQAWRGRFVQPPSCMTGRRRVTNGRETTLDMAKRENITDVFVIGGGVNGCGIARDAAGRGFSVFLAEMGDLASGTSSAATKLVHGGLRYLEYYEFRLVREALAERGVLCAIAAPLILPLHL